MLSIAIPIYNERETIAKVLVEVAAALPSVSKQIVVVDDGSTDGTRDWLAANFPAGTARCAGIAMGAGGNLDLLQDEKPEHGSIDVKVVMHDENRGKGGALQTGFREAAGDVIVIQDADLEYDPKDWSSMYPLITERRVADVVYGSRFYGMAHRSLNYHHYLANRLISVLFNLLYNQTLTDIEVCYKMMRREVLESLTLNADDFGIEVQISAQVALARKWRIYEVGITYFGRSYDEGKKINWKDGVKAIWYICKYRFKPV